MVFMPKTRPAYPPEFRRQAVELVRLAGRPIPNVARELGCSQQSLRTWVKQADIDGGVREGLSSEEREELRKLRAARSASCARSATSWEKRSPSSPRSRRPGELLSVHRGGEGQPPGRRALPRPRRLARRLLCVAEAADLGAGTPRRRAAGAHPRDPRRERRHLRVAADARRAAPPRGPREPQAHRPAHAPGRPQRPRAAPQGQDHDPRCPASCPRPTSSRATSTRPSPTRCGRPTSPRSRTWEGVLNLAVVVGCFSRCVVGWVMAEHRRAELVVEALEMAVWQRQPALGLVHHSVSETAGVWLGPGGLTRTAIEPR
jgi:transposase-like protein